MRALLDINILIALLDTGHIMHDAATSWLELEIENGWASCPLTQNGTIRILSQPAYPNSQPAALVAERLMEACANDQHLFWTDSISLLSDKTINWHKILGHRQITDSYLLALAVQNEGRFVTFDQNVVLNTVEGATSQHLTVITH